MIDQPTMWQRSTTRRFLKWLFSWRTARRILMGVATLATAVALFYAEEDFRGKHAWDKYRGESETRGEQLDFKAFIPKPVPDDQNFAAAPFVKSWFARSNHIYTGSKYWGNDNYGRVGSAVSSSRDKKDAGNRHFTDLVAWKMAFDALRTGELDPQHFRNARRPGQRPQKEVFESDTRDLASRAKAAPAVLEALKTNQAMFAELRAASQRPLSRYPIDYDAENPCAILLPHLNGVRAVCRRLQLKACGELALGQSEEALGDVKLSFYIADSVKEDPFLIPYLVRVACFENTTQSIWEGLAEHAWSDAQLRELETRLQQVDFVADLKQAFDAERAQGIAMIDFIKHHMGKVYDLTELGNDRALVLWLAGMPPSGWYDQEQVGYCRLCQVAMAGTFDPGSRRVSPNRIAANERALDREFSGGSIGAIFGHRFMARMLLPALGAVVRKGAGAQVAVDQAALACALERYRLANGQFPERLDALVPGFTSQLPHDVITDEPYKYRRTDDGQIVLYSVGWNEKDDGGVPGKEVFDAKEGDWVWQYPASR